MINVKDIMTGKLLTEADSELYLILDVSALGLTDYQFFRLCRDNGDFHIEMSGEGELIIVTERADYGAETRQAHSKVGKLVRAGRNRGCL
jgi:hypothetical protein